MNRKTLKAVSLILSIALLLSTVFISGTITTSAVNTTAQEPFFEDFEGETVGDPIDQINTWQSSPAVIAQENENEFMSLKRSSSSESATALLMSDVLNLSDNGSALKTLSFKFKLPEGSISDADSKGVRFRIYYWKQTEKVDNVAMGDYYFDIYYTPATDGGKWYLYASGANSTTGYQIDADLTEWTQFSMRYYLSKNDPISVIPNKASPITTGSFYYTEWNLSQGNEILLANGSYDGQNAVQWYNFGRYGTVPTKLKESYPDGVLPVSGYGTTVGFSIESGTTYKDKSNKDVSFTDEPTVLFDDVKLTYYSEAEVNKKMDLYSSTTQSDDLGLGGYSRVNGLNNDAYYSEYVANSQYVREENDQSEVSFDFEDAIVPFYPTVLPEQQYEESQKVVSINSASIVSDPIGADNKVLKLRNNINQCSTYAAGYKFELFDSVCSDDNLIDNVSFDIYNPNGAQWSFIYEDNDFTSDSYDGTDANNLCRYITFSNGTNSGVQINYDYVTAYNADTFVETKTDALFAGASNTKVTWKDWVHIDLKYDYDKNYIIYTFTGKDTNGVEQTATHINRGTVYTNVYAAKKIAFGLLHSSTLDDLYIDNFSMSYVNATQPELPPVVEPTPEELAAEFVAKYEAVINKVALEDTDVATVDAAIAEYATLDAAVQAHLTEEIEKLNTLKTNYETAQANKAKADKFKEDYKDTIALDEIKNDDELADVNTMLDAYAKLDEAVKEIVKLDVSKYEGLKAVYIAAKEAAEAAKAFNETYSKGIELTKITNDAELEAVNAMLAAYAQLDDAVQKLVNVDVAKYQAMIEAYETEKANKAAADKFITDHKDALNAEKINSDEELEAVKAMLQAYEALSDAAKAFAGNVDVAKYEAMIAVYNTEKANKATAAEYEKNHAAALALKVIENDDELAAADAALADYAELTDGVKAYLAEDIEARLTGMTGAYRAEKAAQKAADDYKDAYKTTLEISKIRSEEANALVDTAIEAYKALSRAAQDKLGAEIATLNALKAEYAEFLAKVYTPEIKGATIRRQGTQTIGYKCQINNLREDLEVVEYGMIVTANSFIQEGLVAEEDLTLGGLNDYVRAVSSDDVASIVEGAEIIANIGNVSSNNYGVRYVVRVYIKYEDGTVDYSNVLGRSVIQVAKSIASWTFNNKTADELAGLLTPITDIIADVAEDGTITYAPGATDNNGVKILEYLETNNEIIAIAYNKLDEPQ